MHVPLNLLLISILKIYHSSVFFFFLFLLYVFLWSLSGSAEKNTKHSSCYFQNYRTGYHRRCVAKRQACTAIHLVQITAFTLPGNASSESWSIIYSLKQSSWHASFKLSRVGNLNWPQEVWKTRHSCVLCVIYSACGSSENVIFSG